MNYLKFIDFPELPYAVEEAMNRLRINISFCSKDVRKIMVVSSTPNEGKSYVSVHLWRKLAEAGASTILVDCDFRKSVFKERCQYESEKPVHGLSYYLSGQTTLEESIYKTNFENADILPLVKTISNPAMLLESSLFTDMLDQLSKTYRYVIIDCSPLGLVADGERIASLSDGALLVVRAGETSRRLVRQSMQQLSRAGCPLIGTVLNRAEGRGSGYYSKYGKYSKYGDSYGYYGGEGQSLEELKQEAGQK